MERWLDTKASYWACGSLFLAVCVITYAACIQCGAPHPTRTVMIVAVGLVVAIVMIGLLFAVVFAPLLMLIGRLSGRRNDKTHNLPAQTTVKPEPSR
jgi:hypothetical protein